VLDVGQLVGDGLLAGGGLVLGCPEEIPHADLVPLEQGEQLGMSGGILLLQGAGRRQQLPVPHHLDAELPRLVPLDPRDNLVPLDRGRLPVAVHRLDRGANRVEPGEHRRHAARRQEVVDPFIGRVPLLDLGLEAGGDQAADRAALGTGNVRIADTVHVGRQPHDLGAHLLQGRQAVSPQGDPGEADRRQSALVGRDVRLQLAFREPDDGEGAAPGRRGQRRYVGAGNGTRAPFRFGTQPDVFPGCLSGRLPVAVAVGRRVAIGPDPASAHLPRRARHRGDQQAGRAEERELPAVVQGEAGHLQDQLGRQAGPPADLLGDLGPCLGPGRQRPVSAGRDLRAGEAAPQQGRVMVGRQVEDAREPRIGRVARLGVGRLDAPLATRCGGDGRPRGPVDQHEMGVGPVPVLLRPLVAGVRRRDRPHAHHERAAAAVGIRTPAGVSADGATILVLRPSGVDVSRRAPARASPRGSRLRDVARSRTIRPGDAHGAALRSPDVSHRPNAAPSRDAESP
jgi:hypothetical protein